MDIAQKAINNKDALISERTDIQGVSSGVSMRTGRFNSQLIVLIDKNGNEYKFNFGRRTNKLKDLPSFIEQLNSLLEVKQIDKEFED